MEYKRPKKLKIRPLDTQKVKAAKAPEGMPKVKGVSEPSPELKVKKAQLEPTMKKLSQKASTKTAKEKSKIPVIKAKGGKYYQSDRIKEEIKTEQMADEMVKKLRLKQKIKTNKKLKGY